MQRALKGTINVYSESVRAGTIIGADKNTYMFSLKDWTSPTLLEVGITVVFIPEGNRAKSVRQS